MKIKRFKHLKQLQLVIVFKYFPVLLIIVWSRAGHIDSLLFLNLVVNACGNRIFIDIICPTLL